MRQPYNINYKKAAVSLLPVFLRGKIITAVLSAALRPVIYLYERFIVYTNESEKLLEVRSQVCRLESLLNDNFDYHDRRIQVRNKEIDFDKFLLWKEGLQKPIVIYKDIPTLFCKDGFLGTTEPDFEIVVPKGFDFTYDEIIKIKGLVNKHKLASKKMTIIYG